MLIPKMSNILVTGGCGFIGSNFLNSLVKKYYNCDFFNLDVVNYCASIDNIDKETSLSFNYFFIKNNINNQDIYKLLVDNKITHIIHLAAQSHVDSSFIDIDAFMQDNIIATQKLLTASSKYNTRYKGMLKLFLYISTDEVYGETINQTPITENTALNPTNPYAATKASAEMLVNSFYYSFKLPIIITRSNNVYGPRQYTEKLIPKFITNINDLIPLPIHGDGKSMRSFIHVDDLVDALELIINKGVIGQVYNIGSVDEFSVIEIAEILSKELNQELNMEFVCDRLFNDSRYLINYDKIKNLGFAPKVKFIDGIKQTIEWYKKL